jgi:hypothetical protein
MTQANTAPTIKRPTLTLARALVRPARMGAQGCQGSVEPTKEDSYRRGSDPANGQTGQVGAGITSQSTGQNQTDLDQAGFGIRNRQPRALPSNAYRIAAPISCLLWRTGKAARDGYP